MTQLLDFHCLQGNSFLSGKQFYIAEGSTVCQCTDVNSQGISYLSANKYVEHKLSAKPNCIFDTVFPCSLGQHYKSLLPACCLWLMLANDYFIYCDIADALGEFLRSQSVYLSNLVKSLCFFSLWWIMLGLSLFPNGNKLLWNPRLVLSHWKSFVNTYIRTVYRVSLAWLISPDLWRLWWVCIRRENCLSETVGVSGSANSAPFGRAVRASTDG